MNHPLGDALMVEVEELLTQVKISEGRGAARADLERILVVRYRDALLCGQDGRIAIRALVHFAARAGHHALLSILCRLALAGGALAHVTSRVFRGHSAF